MPGKTMRKLLLQASVQKVEIQQKEKKRIAISDFLWYVFGLPKEVVAWQRNEPTATEISANAKTADGRGVMWSDTILTPGR